MRFCLKGGVQLHPPGETEEEEELHKLWRRLCEELQGKRPRGSLEPFNSTESTAHVVKKRRPPLWVLVDGGEI